MDRPGTGKCGRQPAGLRDGNEPVPLLYSCTAIKKLNPRIHQLPSVAFTGLSVLVIFD